MEEDVVESKDLDDVITPVLLAPTVRKSALGADTFCDSAMSLDSAMTTEAGETALSVDFEGERLDGMVEEMPDNETDWGFVSVTTVETLEGIKAVTATASTKLQRWNDISPATT